MEKDKLKEAALKLAKEKGYADVTYYRYFRNYNIFQALNCLNESPGYFPEHLPLIFFDNQNIARWATPDEADEATILFL